MIQDKPKRFNAKSTEKRIAIFDELADQAGTDRNDLINKLMHQWSVRHVEDDLKQPVKDVFGY